MSDSGEIKISKIEIIVNRGPGEDEGPREVPMFDQTMSILNMIKEQKVSLFFVICLGKYFVKCRF